MEKGDRKSHIFNHSQHNSRTKSRFSFFSEYRIDPRSYELVLEEWPEENSARTGFEPHDLYDTGAALYQLS